MTADPLLARSLVAGQWRGAGPGEPMWSPYDGAEVGRLFAAGANDVDDAALAAAGALPSWRDTPAHRRAEVLGRLAQLLEERADDLAWAMTRQGGSSRARWTLRCWPRAGSSTGP